MHGMTARQVSRGLAAPLLVRGELDRIPKIAAAREYVLMLQDFNITEGEVKEPSFEARVRGREGEALHVVPHEQPVVRGTRARPGRSSDYGLWRLAPASRYRPRRMGSPAPDQRFPLPLLPPAIEDH
jgi:hypothetical protein